MERERRGGTARLDAAPDGATLAPIEQEPPVPRTNLLDYTYALTYRYAMPLRRKDPAAVSLGRRGGLKGGKARAARLTPEERRESARRAVLARWERQQKPRSYGEVPSSASQLADAQDQEQTYSIFLTDCFEWLNLREPASIHAIVTDPPYGLVEFTETEKAKLRGGRGGIWRIPPSFDGNARNPLPRFTVLSTSDHQALTDLVDGPEPHSRYSFPARIFSLLPIHSCQTLFQPRSVGRDSRNEEKSFA